MAKPNFPFSGPIDQGRFALCDPSDNTKQLQFVMTDLNTGKQVVLFGKAEGSLQLGPGATPSSPGGDTSLFISGPSSLDASSGELGIGIRAEAPAVAPAGEVVEAAIAGYSEEGYGELSIYTVTEHPIVFYTGSAGVVMTLGTDQRVTFEKPILTPLASGAQGLPNATTAGAGAMLYDTTLSMPLWSDGFAWRDAAGNAV